MNILLKKAIDYITDFQAFTYEYEFSQRTLDILTQNNLSRIWIVDKDKVVQGEVRRENLLKSAIHAHTSNPLVEKNVYSWAVPNNSAYDVLRKMKNLNTNVLPVVNNNLEKKLLGFIRMQDLQNDLSLN